MLTQDRTSSPECDLSGLWEEGRQIGQSKGAGPEALSLKRKLLFFPLFSVKRPLERAFQTCEGFLRNAVGKHLLGRIYTPAKCFSMLAIFTLSVANRAHFMCSPYLQFEKLKIASTIFPFVWINHICESSKNETGGILVLGDTPLGKQNVKCPEKSSSVTYYSQDWTHLSLYS